MITSCGTVLGVEPDGRRRLGDDRDQRRGGRVGRRHAGRALVEHDPVGDRRHVDALGERHGERRLELAEAVELVQHALAQRLGRRGLAALRGQVDLARRGIEQEVVGERDDLVRGIELDDGPARGLVAVRLDIGTAAHCEEQEEVSQLRHGFSNVRTSLRGPESTAV
jgi:hypothetical protein